MVVTLIGYRGCGKSSVGKLLASELGWTFADADDQLENAAGKSIRQIFADDGEAVFRDWEETTIEKLLQQDKLVLATGGGAILRETTRTRIASAGPVVWLMASAEELFRRIETDATTGERRPNLTNAGGLDEVRQLLSERTGLYRSLASYEIETEGRTTEEIARDILRQLPPLGEESA